IASANKNSFCGGRDADRSPLADRSASLSESSLLRQIRQQIPVAELQEIRRVHAAVAVEVERAVGHVGQNVIRTELQEIRRVRRPVPGRVAEEPENTGERSGRVRRGVGRQNVIVATDAVAIAVEAVGGGWQIPYFAFLTFRPPRPAAGPT